MAYSRLRMSLQLLQPAVSDGALSIFEYLMSLCLIDLGWSGNERVMSLNCDTRDTMVFGFGSFRRNGKYLHTRYNSIAETPSGLNNLYIFLPTQQVSPLA